MGVPKVNEQGQLLFHFNDHNAYEWIWLEKTREYTEESPFLSESCCVEILGIFRRLNGLFLELAERSSELVLRLSSDYPLAISMVRAGLFWRAIEFCLHYFKAGQRPHDSEQTFEAYRAVNAMAKQHGMKVTRLKRREAQRDYGKTVVSAQRNIRPNQRVIFNVRGHTMGFHNGTSDWANGRRHHIGTVWEIQKAA